MSLTYYKVCTLAVDSGDGRMRPTETRLWFGAESFDDAQAYYHETLRRLLFEHPQERKRPKCYLSTWRPDVHGTPVIGESPQLGAVS